MSQLIPRHALTPRASDGERDTTDPTPLSNRHLLELATGSAFATWAAIALATFLVSAAVDLGFSPSAAGTLLFVGSAFSIGARVAFGMLSDHLRSRGFALMATVTAVGAVAFVLLTLTTGAWFAVVVLAAFSSGWAWPGLMTYTVVNANRKTVATSSAITQAGVFVGAGLGPLLLGAVIERWSFDGAWLTAAAGLVIASLLIGWLGRATRPLN